MYKQYFYCPLKALQMITAMATVGVFHSRMREHFSVTEKTFVNFSNYRNVKRERRNQYFILNEL